MRLLFIVILILVIVGGWLYFQQDNNVFTQITGANSCIGASEINNYGVFENENGYWYVFKEWSLGQFEGSNIPEATVFAMPNTQTEYMYIWISGYAFDTSRFLEDTIRGLENVTIMKEEYVNNYKNPYKRVLVEYLLEDGTIMYQDAFGFVKNNKGYGLILRSSKINYNANYEKFLKTVCSFDPK